VLGPDNFRTNQKKPFGLLIELRLSVGTHEALFEHQPGQHADGKGAAAEAEAENLVVFGDDAVLLILGLGFVVPAKEFVDAQNIALEAEPERAAKDGGRLERRRADAVIIDRDLVGLGQVDGFERAPDIGSPNLGGGIARSVRQQDDPLWHGAPPACGAHIRSRTRWLSMSPLRGTLHGPLKSRVAAQYARDGLF